MPSYANISSTIGGPPDSRQRHSEDELDELRRAFNQLLGELKDIQYAAPAKPRQGMFAYADGATWNPGAGAGLYQYQGGAWVKL